MIVEWNLLDDCVDLYLRFDELKVQLPVGCFELTDIGIVK
jgi:hypothetical protein